MRNSLHQHLIARKRARMAAENEIQLVVVRELGAMWRQVNAIVINMDKQRRVLQPMGNGEGILHKAMTIAEPGIWTSFQDRLSTAIRHGLQNHVVNMADLEHYKKRGYDLVLNPVEIVDEYESYIGAHEGREIKDIGDDTRKKVASLVSTWYDTPGRTVGELLDDLHPMFDNVRADRIAVTETTFLNSEVQAHVFNQLGVKSWWWQTSRDELVCHEMHEFNGTNWAGCHGLHGHAFKLGQKMPPLHPHCRCEPVANEDAFEKPAPIVTPVEWAGGIADFKEKQEEALAAQQLAEAAQHPLTPRVDPALQGEIIVVKNRINELIDTMGQYKAWIDPSSPILNANYTKKYNDLLVYLQDYLEYLDEPYIDMSGVAMAADNTEIEYKSKMPDITSWGQKVLHKWEQMPDIMDQYLALEGDMLDLERAAENVQVPGFYDDVVAQKGELKSLYDTLNEAAANPAAWYDLESGVKSLYTTLRATVDKLKSDLAGYGGLEPPEMAEQAAHEVELFVAWRKKLLDRVLAINQRVFKEIYLAQYKGKVAGYDPEFKDHYKQFSVAAGRVKAQDPNGGPNEEDEHDLSQLESMLDSIESEIAELAEYLSQTYGAPAATVKVAPSYGDLEEERQEVIAQAWGSVKHAKDLITKYKLGNPDFLGTTEWYKGYYDAWPADSHELNMQFTDLGDHGDWGKWGPGTKQKRLQEFKVQIGKVEAGLDHAETVLQQKPASGTPDLVSAFKTAGQAMLDAAEAAYSKAGDWMLAHTPAASSVAYWKIHWSDLHSAWLLLAAKKGTLSKMLDHVDTVLSQGGHDDLNFAISTTGQAIQVVEAELDKANMAEVMSVSPTTEPGYKDVMDEADHWRTYAEQLMEETWHFFKDLPSAKKHIDSVLVMSTARMNLDNYRTKLTTAMSDYESHQIAVSILENAIAKVKEMYQELQKFFETAQNDVLVGVVGTFTVDAGQEVNIAGNLVDMANELIQKVVNWYSGKSFISIYAALEHHHNNLVKYKDELQALLDSYIALPAGEALKELVDLNQTVKGAIQAVEQAWNDAKKAEAGGGKDWGTMFQTAIDEAHSLWAQVNGWKNTHTYDDTDFKWAHKNLDHSVILLEHAWDLYNQDHSNVMPLNWQKLIDDSKKAMVEEQKEWDIAKSVVGEDVPSGFTIIAAMEAAIKEAQLTHADFGDFSVSVSNTYEEYKTKWPIVWAAGAELQKATDEAQELLKLLQNDPTNTTYQGSVQAKTKLLETQTKAANQVLEMAKNMGATTPAAADPDIVVNAQKLVDKAIPLLDKMQQWMTDNPYPSDPLVYDELKAAWYALQDAGDAMGPLLEDYKNTGEVTDIITSVPKLKGAIEQAEDMLDAANSLTGGGVPAATPYDQSTPWTPEHFSYGDLQTWIDQAHGVWTDASDWFKKHGGTTEYKTDMQYLSKMVNVLKKDLANMQGGLNYKLNLVKQHIAGTWAAMEMMKSTLAGVKGIITSKIQPKGGAVKVISQVQGMDMDKLHAANLHKTIAGWKNPSNPRYGGLIFNDDGKILLREPKDHHAGYVWTFSKGGANNGEHMVDAALREVKEESGHTGEVVGLLDKGYGSGSSTTYYFMMKSTGVDEAAMKANGETIQTRWCTLDEAKALIALDTYDAGKVRDLKVVEDAFLEHQKILSGKADYDQYLVAQAGPAKRPKAPVVFPEVKDIYQRPESFPKSVDTLKKVADYKLGFFLTGYGRSGIRIWDELQKIKQLKGAGGGGQAGAALYEDPATHKQYVLKDASGLAGGNNESSSKWLEEESRTDNMYRAVGVKVPASCLYQTAGGQTVKLAEFIPDAQDWQTFINSAPKAKQEDAKKQLQQGFAADALLANWDVIGHNDNVIVDKAGTVWRIDNGSGMRYSGLGSKKPEPYGNTPWELWTMRNRPVTSSGTGPNAVAIYGSMSYRDVVDSMRDITNNRDALLALTPKEVQETVSNRIDNMAHLVKAHDTQESSRWTDKYRDEFAHNLMEIRSIGIHEVLPRKLTSNFSGGTWNTEVVDEFGEKYDGLRGDEGALKMFHDYVNSHGGSWSAIESWASDQAGSSWSHTAKAIKWFMANNAEDGVNRCYWGEDDPNSDTERQTAMDSCRRAWNDISKSMPMERSIGLLHAFTYETLNDSEFAHKDKDTNNVLLVRTETSTVFKKNHAGTKGVGPKIVKFRRGAAESCSLLNPYSVKGDQLTEQEVPISDILGTYWFDRSGGSGGGHQDFFLGAHENEFVTFLGDKEMRWVGHYGSYFQDVPEAKTPEYTTWKTP